LLNGFIDVQKSDDFLYFYEPIFCASIKLSLRRTLVLYQEAAMKISKFQNFKMYKIFISTLP